MKNKPVYESGFDPIYAYLIEHNKAAQKKVRICIQRENGYNFVYEMGLTQNIDRDYRIVERIVKCLIWAVGGHTVFLDNEILAQRLKKDYCKGGAREFDALFMQRIYEKPFEVVFEQRPIQQKDNNLSIGGNFGGCRIGFDAGGSDRKVSAVVDGKCIYSEEVVWFPKINANPDYHYNEIKKAMLTAAQKMPRVDSIGVSSAGIYINNRVMAASLFVQVPQDKFDSRVKNMYIDIAKEIGAPLAVANDGDVSALAGSMELKDNRVLGLAFGTSEAAGYITAGGGINGWLNELAFVAVDMNQNAAVDDWSNDIGCGSRYFSQEAVIRLAQNAGIEFEQNSSPAEKLKIVQGLNNEGDPRAARVFEDIGIFLGHTIPFYAQFYNIKHLILLGRVMSGKGGDSILQYAQKVVCEEYPQFSGINIIVPDENSRRVGQSVAAASL